MNACDSFSSYMAFETELIDKYLFEHKPYSHEEKQVLASEFIQQYAWCIRYIYCHYICPHRSGCSLANNIKLQSSKKLRD